jgi:3-deoxy-D-manno-octulosonate 8-phosphate phosphatase (KDO 8-P phosphatase)
VVFLYFFMNIFESFKKIKTFIFDVDGVLTDGNLLVTEAGELLRTMNSKDGYAMKHALENGYKICIITGGKSDGVVLRLKGLGLTDIFYKVGDKVPVFNQYLNDNNLNADEILYMGDDMPDYEVMQLVGLPTCPQDAVSDIINITKYVSPLNGGDGCVRDVIEKVMKLQDLWF